MYNIPKFTIIIPVFNEAQNLPIQIKLLKKERLLDYAFFVDDGSTDDTNAVLKANNCNFVRQNNKGVGKAIKVGIENAISNKIPICVVMAGDNQDHPREIFSLVDPILKNQYDFIQGSRYLSTKNHAGVIWKKTTTKIYSFIFSFIARQKITDASNGFRAFRTKIIIREKLLDNKYNNYDFEPFLLLTSILRGYRVREKPVNKYYNISTGYTKMKPIISWILITLPLLRILQKIRKIPR